jgi:multidrug efflux pump subunit AcrA (membrane-fusion protein)
MTLTLRKTVTAVLMWATCPLAGVAVLAARAAPPDSPVTGAERVRLVRLASPRGGTLLVLGTELKDGEEAPAGRLVSVKVGKESHRYRQLRLGDRVEEGQVVGLIDPATALAAEKAAAGRLQAAEDELRSATKTREEAERRMKAMEAANRKVPSPRSDAYQGAVLTFHRYREEEDTRATAVKTRKAELEHSRAVLATYMIRSPARGVVREIVKSPGEAVQSGDLLLRVEVAERH